MFPALAQHAIGPERVRIDVEERSRAEQRQRLDHPAAGTQHVSPLVRYDDARSLTARDVIDDLVRQIVHVDYGFADTSLGELVEHMIEQRSARHTHQWLWHMIGQRAHPYPEAGREYHCFVGSD